MLQPPLVLVLELLVWLMLEIRLATWHWKYQTVLQKTSISCVEDGVSLPSSRIQLGYGGSDVTQLLHYLSRWLLIWVNPVLGYMIHF